MALVRRSGTWLACGLCLGACSERPSAPEPFAIAHTSPVLEAASEPLLLNDSITVYFSADVLPVSVTGNSVTLVDERGQAVPGSLRVGSNWVTFQPVPPVTPELTDGSYQPGASYRLLVAGSPRPDAVRAADGRRLAAATSFPVRIAAANDRPAGLPAPLRPAGNDIPFFLRNEGQQPLPADAPRLLLHFTQPVLPSSVTSDAFEITLLDRPPPFERILPRHVRVLPPRLQVPRFDEPPGSTVEIDLGVLPERASGAPPESLPLGKSVYVQLRQGAGGVRDYAGQAALPRDPPAWSIVAGNSLPLAEWGSRRDAIVADDGLSPTFEVRGGIRPRVRVEAGNGSLGVFRPRVDTTLRPGQAFDRGDGEFVVSRGSEFPFLAIDVPAHVTVRIEAEGAPVQLLACGSVRIAGTLLVAATPQRLPAGRSSTVPVRDLAAQVPAAIIAAGDIDLRGRVFVATAATDDKTNLLLATASAIDLRALAGELPFQTMLAVEADNQEGRGVIRGPRGQSTLYLTSFTYGVAPGGDYTVAGTLPWRQLPVERDGGVVHFVEAGRELQFAWQSAPADPVRKNEPDLAVGRCSRLQPALDQDTLAVTAGAFVRFALTARVQAGIEPPCVSSVRLCDR